MMIETDCYASGWHLHDDAEREHFRRQVMAYLARLRQRFSQLADDAGGDGIRIESLGSAYLQTHAEFRVRFWLVETVIDLARRKSFPPAGAVERIMQATDLARCLLSPKSAAIRDQLCAARKSLAQALPGHVHEIVIAYDPAEPTLSSDDEFAWWR
ncbi:MAG: hypothetical protein ABJF10_13675, partial [Chthoniobacter sp.]|uniref:hypothetical protein n=1 Tax=Chthoniobacter sp. TaxID=2510640 RepID=UPI0032A7AC0E